MKIKKGDKIKVDYEGRFESGEVFDSSKHGDHSHPLEFVAGSGQVIRGFDDAVIGMEKGQEKEFSIESKEAYGELNPELQREVPRTALPKEQEPKEGMVLILGSPDGRQFPVRITKVTKDSVTIDLNHPLAGKKLIFKIKIAEVEGEKKEMKKEQKNNTVKKEGEKMEGFNRSEGGRRFGGGRSGGFGGRSGGFGGNRGRSGGFGGPRRFGGSFNDRPREMHKAVCSECKQECEVPFKQTQGKPVYCRECFRNKRN